MTEVREATVTGQGTVAAWVGALFLRAGVSPGVKISTHAPGCSLCKALGRHRSVFSVHLPFDSEMSIPALNVTEMLAYGHHDVCPILLTSRWFKTASNWKSPLRDSLNKLQALHFLRLQTAS